MRKTVIVLGVAGILGFAGGYAFLGGEAEAEPAVEAAAAEEAAPAPQPDSNVQRVDITPGSTFANLMEDAGIGASEAYAIHEASKKAYDLAKIRVGRAIVLTRNPASGALQELMYPVSNDEELYVRREGEGWKAALEKIAYEVKVKTTIGVVDSSLYLSGLDQGLDERTVIAFADVFEWTLDFSQDVRQGDSYAFVYEERWRDGKYVMPGSVIAAKYVNSGKTYEGYRFVDSSGEEGYYDEKGESLRRMFLKAPLAFKYISSGFTTGRRYVAAFNVSTGHRAIDYAAALGTPIRATADGTVVMAGWNGPYGNMVSIRHNGTYTTNYAHQSKMAVKRGQKVSQGQIIGYVGSTGFSTGPHLHYEMVKNGVKINPQRETFAASAPVAAGDRAAFQEVVKEWQDKL